MRILECLVFGILLNLLLIIQPRTVYAASPRFEITTDITYKIGDDGNTLVTQNFYLTNLTSEYAPDEYVTNPGITDLKNIRAFDQNGPISAYLWSAQQEEIHVKLPRDVVGMRKTYSWTLIYETADIAKKVGRLWEISILKPADVEGLINYNVSLSVPSSFGKEIELTPKSSVGGHVWTKSDFSSAKSGIWAVYDPTNSPQSYQAFNFKITYALSNPKLYSVLADIYLPPDTAYQKIFLDTLSPKPVNVVLDQDGNWKAQYQLGPTGKLEVVAAGSLGLFGSPHFRPISQTVGNNGSQRKVTGIIGTKTLGVWEEFLDPGSGAWVAGNNPDSSADFRHVALIINQDKFVQPETELTPISANLDFTQIPKVGLRVDVPKEIIAGFPATATVYVENYGPTSFSGDIVSLEPKILSLHQKSLAAGPLPPFSTQTLEFKIHPSTWNLNQNDIITLKFAQEERQYNTQIKPFYKNGFLLTVVILFSLGIISIATQIARSLLFQRQKGQDNIHR
ncbi:hypothetical protein M1403_00715 [Patescibacteria group bacterium]|nr:hypothetical protein [Patescibacteria group bacterium]